MKSILDILADMEYIIEDADGDLCILKRKEDGEVFLRIKDGS